MAAQFSTLERKEKNYGMESDWEDVSCRNRVDKACSAHRSDFRTEDDEYGIRNKHKKR